MPVKKFIAERQRFFEVLQQVDFLVSYLHKPIISCAK